VVDDLGQARGFGRRLIDLDSHLRERELRAVAGEIFGRHLDGVVTIGHRPERQRQLEEMEAAGGGGRAELDTSGAGEGDGGAADRRLVQGEADLEERVRAELGHARSRVVAGARWDAMTAGGKRQQCGSGDNVGGGSMRRQTSDGGLE